LKKGTGSGEINGSAAFHGGAKRSFVGKSGLWTIGSATKKITSPSIIGRITRSGNARR
jgi:hypothetical protein